MKVAGKKIWIVGAARSGLAAARLLKQHGAEIFITDSNTIEAEQKKILIELGIPFEEKGHSIDRLLEEAQLVVLSPSIPLDKPLPFSVRQAGIPLVSEIEIASWFLPANAVVVGITGTNGKSTTTHYAAQLFNAGGRKAVACGNIGRPFADTLTDPSEYDAFIVELSSYQLETTMSLRPHVSILLNLQNDHLARYGSMEEYLKAKWRLVLLTRDDGMAVVDETVVRRAVAAGLPMPACALTILRSEPQQEFQSSTKQQVDSAQFSSKCPPELYRTLPQSAYGKLRELPLQKMISSPGARIIAIKNTTSSSDSIDVFCTRMDNLQIEDHFTIEKSCLDGHHNQVNIAAASVSARHSGIAEQIIRAQWNAKSSAYIHLPHRLEDVCKGAVLQASQGERKQVRAINDSKATNVESTIVALKSFNTPVRLLLGGEPKGDLYSDILPFVGKNVCMVYPFGKAAPLICEQLKKAAQYLAEPSSKMTDAAEKALDDALNGDIILLSPACASFDEFRNFEHRGDVFKDWVASKAVR